VYGAMTNVNYTLSLLGTYELLHKKGVDFDVVFVKYGSIISRNRSLIVKTFLETDATDLFFIDADEGFPPEKALALLERPEDIVGGVYPNKTNWEGDFPVLPKLDRRKKFIWSKDKKLIEVKRLATGFMRIKRRVLKKMVKAYPDLKWVEYWIFARKINELYDFFRHVGSDGKWTGEDYGFCDRWRAIGGKMWVYPDIDFVHSGMKEWTGNYSKYLVKD
jgi:hypothetical protein